MTARARPFRRSWLVLALAALLPALPLALSSTLSPAWAGTALIYVTNSAGDSIHVIDPATNKVVQEIKGVEAAHGIAPAPDGARVYVSNEADSTLDVFDRESGALIKKVPLSNHPNNIAVTKNGDRILVGIARGQGAVDVIDAKALTRTKSILVKGRLHNIYVTPDGKYLITGSIPGKLMTVIDLEREVPVWELPFDLGVRPMTIEANPDGSTKRVFIQLSDTNGFAVVDFAARKEVARIKLPVAKAEFETDAGRATSPSHGIGVAPDGGKLWVTSIAANAVYAYSLPELKLLGEARLP
jgi:YVTN family beta-propeller protein